MVVILVIILILYSSDSANRKLLLWVVDGTGKDILFLPFSFPLNTSTRVFLGVGVEEIRPG